MRRLLRIWPALAAVVTVSFALVLLFADSTYAPSSSALSLHKALLPTAAEVYLRNNLVFINFEWGFFPASFDPRLNGPLWTIRYELACYGLLAFAAFVSGRRWTIYGALLCLPMYFWWKWGAQMVEPGGGSTQDAMLTFAAFFFCGALVHSQKALQDTKLALAIVAGGLGLIALGSELLGLILVVPFLCVLIGLRSWPILRSTARYGDISYGLYLWAWPIQQIGILWLGRDAPFGVLLTLTLATTTLMALLSWHLVEKQFLKLKTCAAMGAAYSRSRVLMTAVRASVNAITAKRK